MLVTNKASKSRAANFPSKGFKFFARAFGNQFNPSVRQIADDTGDFKTGGDISYRVTEADALHVT